MPLNLYSVPTYFVTNDKMFDKIDRRIPIQNILIFPIGINFLHLGKL